MIPCEGQARSQEGGKGMMGVVGPSQDSVMPNHHARVQEGVQV